MNLYINNDLTHHFSINDREDRVTKLLLKLEDYECRDHPNGRMISHLNNMINSTKGRLEGAKIRYNDLKDEVGIMKKDELKSRKIDKMRKKQQSDIVVEGGTMSSNDSDVFETSEEEEEDDDDNDSDIDRSIEFHNGSSHSTSTISRLTTTPMDELSNNNDNSSIK